LGYGNSSEDDGTKEQSAGPFISSSLTMADISFAGLYVNDANIHGIQKSDYRDFDGGKSGQLPLASMFLSLNKVKSHPEDLGRRPL
jgi:hypothetical protein